MAASEQLALTIRRRAVQMANHAHASHIGSVLSVADIIAVLYSDVLRVNPRQPDKPDRDRFILSKGHAGSALSAALAALGFFDASHLEHYGENGSLCSGHVTSTVPGVEFSTGSLGHGLAVGAGIALAAQLRKSDVRVFVVLGDGECDEGAVWETALFSAHHQLSNLTAIVDCNGSQGLGNCQDVLNLEPFDKKWVSFGWETVCVDGHDHAALKQALSERSLCPRCLLARTVKGKGVSFMENQLLWHYRDPQGACFDQALAELGGEGA
jgi:transketolase